MALSHPPNIPLRSTHGGYSQERRRGVTREFKKATVMLTPTRSRLPIPVNPATAVMSTPTRSRLPILVNRANKTPPSLARAHPAKVSCCQPRQYSHWRRNGSSTRAQLNTVKPGVLSSICSSERLGRRRSRLDSEQVDSLSKRKIPESFDQYT